MKQFLFILFLILLSLPGKGQDLHVYYDVALDSIRYEQNNQVLETPYIRKNGRIILHIKNFNDYLYSVKLETKSETYDIPATGSESIFSISPGSNNLDNLRQAAASFSTQAFIPSDGSLGQGEREGFGNSGTNYSNQTTQLLQNYTTALDQMQTMERNIQDLSKAIELDIQSQELNTSLGEELKKVRINPNLSTSKIKAISLEYMTQILDADPDEEYELKDLLNRADTQQNLQEKITNYEKDVESLAQQMEVLKATREVLVQLGELTPEDQAELESTFQLSDERVQAYEEKIQSMEEELPQIKAWGFNDLASIRYQYEEMKDHQFERSFILEPEGDINKISIKLVPLDSLKSSQVPERNLSEVKVTGYGGIKVNASLGLSFAGFFDRPQDYFLNDGVIVGDDLDPFLPIMTSFFHFYPESRSNLSVGGTFGLGIALGGDNAGLQNYFLGPSFIFGKGQRIVLSGGLMTGKVDRLSRGLEVGDPFDSEFIPTKSIFELGYFLGISFNLLNNR